MWKLIHQENDDIKNIQLIFPTRQKLVSDIVRFAKTQDNVKRIVIFGSSTLPRCNYNSDVDLYIDGNLNRMQLYKYLGENDVAIDIWQTEDVDCHLLKEIESKGVVVYER